MLSYYDSIYPKIDYSKPLASSYTTGFYKIAIKRKGSSLSDPPQSIAATSPAGACSYVEYSHKLRDGDTVFITDEQGRVASYTAKVPTVKLTLNT